MDYKHKTRTNKKYILKIKTRNKEIVGEQFHIPEHIFFSKSWYFLGLRAHLHIAKNFPTNIRRIFDEEFFFIRDFSNVKFAKAN